MMFVMLDLEITWLLEKMAATEVSHVVTSVPSQAFRQGMSSDVSSERRMPS
jgi:hypothetical protein